MKLDKKKMMIIGGVLLAVVIGVYFWRKRKAEADALEDLDEDALIDEEAESKELKKSTTATDETDAKDKIAEIKSKRPLLFSPNNKRPSNTKGCPPNSVRMGYLQRPKDSPLLSVHIAGEDRPKARSILRSGYTIKITGTSKFDGNHRVFKTWSDKNGNIGAVYIMVKPQKYASTETADRTFENKACISLVRKSLI